MFLKHFIFDKNLIQHFKEKMVIFINLIYKLNHPYFY